MGKKILLFIVEGISDKDALEPILAELIDEKKVYFEVLRCDATVSNDVQFYNKNMKQRIKIIIDNFLENNHGIKKEHIEKIIFVIDTDGCYIDENHIHFSEKDVCFRYEDDGIYTDRVIVAKERNETKVRNLDMINSASKVYGNIPIETYYFSCNLDHVLHNVRNLEQSLKEEYAANFADNYENNESEFIDFINNKVLVLANEYQESWYNIKINLNSLLRYSNFHLFFMNNLNILKEDIVNKVKKLLVS